MRRFILATSFLFLLSLIAVSQEKKDNAKERATIDKAVATRDKEIADAKKIFDEAVQKSNNKLMSVYDISITSSMKRGGSDGLDTANQFNEEKKLFTKVFEKDAEAMASLTKEKLIKSLTEKTWYLHWEKEQRENALRFGADGTFIGTNPKTKWTIEPRWVVLWDGNLFVPTEPKRFRGFFINTGRPMGMFADEKK